MNLRGVLYLCALCFLVTFLLWCGAYAQQVLPITDPPFTNSLPVEKVIAPLLNGNALVAKVTAALATLATIVGALRLAMKPFALKLQTKLTHGFLDDVTAPGTDHDKYVVAILSGKWYGRGQFWLDFLCSIKLPTLDVYLAKRAAMFPQQVGNTILAGPAVSAPKVPPLAN